MKNILEYVLLLALLLTSPMVLALTFLGLVGLGFFARVFAYIGLAFAVVAIVLVFVNKALMNLYISAYGTKKVTVRRVKKVVA